MIEPKIIDIQTHEDFRGKFYESCTEGMMKSNDISCAFVQDCHSISKLNVVRGMHFQWEPPLGKLVRVSRGSIMDVLIDVRGESKSYGKIFYFLLNDRFPRLLWVPVGFAHGFISLEDDTHVQYKFTSVYNKLGEGGINPLDKDLKIDWGISSEQMIISEKDKNLQSFKEYSLHKKF